MEYITTWTGTEPPPFVIKVYTAKELEDKAIEDMLKEELKEFKQSNINFCTKCGWPLGSDDGCEHCMEAL